MNSNNGPVSAEGTSTKGAPVTLRCSISSIVFPNSCPVCMKEPEDLVSVTIIEKSSYDRRGPAPSRYSSDGGVAEHLLPGSMGASTFWIPTCLRHGTKGLRTGRKQYCPIVTFFVLFYPAIYFLLGILASIYGSRPILQPLISFIVVVGLMLALLLYGYYPRALERAIRFIDVKRGRGEVILQIRNPLYLDQFMNLNEMHAEVVSGTYNADIHE